MNGQNAVKSNAGTQVTLAQKKTVKLAKMAMLVAISLLLVNIHFPIFPPIAFMEYDPADIPILIGTFAFGPVAGIFITIVTALLQGFTVSAASGLYGILMHIVATGTYVLVAGFIYKFHKGKKSAAIALIAGTLAMTAIMIPANLTITPYFMGVPVDAVTALLPFIIAFNLIKAGVNGIITFLVYKRVSKFLHR